MSKKFATAHLSWADRFSLIDHYSPSDTTIMETFNLTKDELATARQLRASGVFTPSKTLDVASYAGIFAQPGSNPVTPTVKSYTNPATSKNQGVTVHAKPESATKRVKVKVPQKRGRKGDKITSALLAAPTAPVPVEAFIKQHGVSLAVLRQAKRFIEKMDADTAAKVGTVNVKQDKTTKQLMIWRTEA